MTGLQRKMKKAKILIIDDSKLDNTILTDIVKEMGFETISVYSPKKALKILKRENIDLILLDIVMKEMNGYEFLEAIHPYKKTTYLPVIFVTSLDSMEYLVEGLEKGAIDYIKKPFSPAEVKARIKVALRIKALNEDLIKMNNKLKEMVIRDSLTGLYNHGYIISKLKEEFSYAKERNTTSSFLMIDIDKFKAINDTYGHLVGDEVLKGLSKFLLKKIGKRGYVGRYGGEEFAIILPGLGIGESVEFTKEVIEDLHITSFYSNNKRDVKLYVSISIGLTEFPIDYKCYVDVTKMADTALYKAKEWGRDMCVIYEGGEFKKI